MVVFLNQRKPRVMVDTNILISGIIWPRWPHAILEHALGNDLQLVLSPLIITETRRKFVDKFSKFLADWDIFLEDCHYDLATAPSIEEVEQSQNLMPDPNDIPIALAAINAQVDYFVSEDKHFTDHNPYTVQLHKQLKIMLSGTFLNQVMRWSHKDLEIIKNRHSLT